jgi:hypothetical protein
MTVTLISRRISSRISATTGEDLKGKNVVIADDVTTIGESATYAVDALGPGRHASGATVVVGAIRFCPNVFWVPSNRRGLGHVLRHPFEDEALTSVSNANSAILSK